MPQEKKRAKGRKIGRHSDRSPSAKAYKAGNRLSINKRKTAMRHRRRMAMKKIHRIEWEIRTRRTTLQAAAEVLQELRHVVSQNHTG